MSSDNRDPNQQHVETRHSLEKLDRGDSIARDKAVLGDEVKGDKISGNKNIANRDFVQNISVTHESDRETKKLQRSRDKLLNQVWISWIEGVLMKSLHNEALIELGVETKRLTTDYPRNMVMTRDEEKQQQVLQGTTMLEIFDQANDSLFILGEPGSGKTTMLLELARLAIERARQNSVKPIPVIFTLSSWIPKKTIAAWIIEELNLRYKFPKKDGKEFLNNNELLLLLDGFDEVKAEKREACVKAINKFRREYNVGLAICCRYQEYEGLKVHLKLNTILKIQPLSVQQIDGYLQNIGSDLADLHRILSRDAGLQEFARTPLILSMLVMSYRGDTVKNLAGLEVASDYRRRLFDDFIVQVFTHRNTKARFITPDVIISTLAGVASEMLVYGESMFYIEKKTDSLNISKRKAQLAVFKEVDKKRVGNIAQLGAGIGGFVAGIPGVVIGGLVGGAASWLVEGVALGWAFGSTLDSATQYMFLRKVGDSYIFLHRMLMEHFAMLNQAKIKELVKRIERERI